MTNATLRDELSNDPLGRGYGTMTDAEVVADLTTASRTRQKASITGSDLWNHTDSTEFNALSETAQQRWLGLCGVDTIDPFGPAEDVAVNLFPADSTTLSNLAAFRVEDISRATELGLGDVKPYDVQKAREQLGVA